MTHSSQLSPLKARRSSPLSGRIRVPGDKSISHRALILGALAVGETRIQGLLESEDVLNTAKAMRALGAQVARGSSGDWSVHGVGVAGFAQPKAPLDFGNSGTGCRLVMGAVAGCPISATFDGDASLRSRPMRRIVDPLALMGAKVTAQSEGGRLPLTLQGARDPLPIEYRSPVASAQIKSAVLLAGLAAPGTTTVIEPAASRDHTELMLKHFGAAIVSVPDGVDGRKISLTGQPELYGAPVAVPADPSSAAFPIVAALIVPGSDVTFDDVMTNPLRTGLFTTLREMGASIEETNARGDTGEPMAQLRVRASKLRGVEVPAARAPSMIDEYLVLAVAAAFAEGTTIMRGLHELRVKESDRLATMAAGLRTLGLRVDETPDGATIHPGRLHGGRIDSHGDHRIAMSFSIAGQISDGEVVIEDIANVATSFPGFDSLATGAGFGLRDAG